MNPLFQPQSFYPTLQANTLVGTSSDSLPLEKKAFIDLADQPALAAKLLAKKTLNQAFSPSQSDIRSKDSTCLSELSLSSPSLASETHGSQIFDTEENFDTLLFPFQCYSDFNEASTQGHQTTHAPENCTKKGNIELKGLSTISSIFLNGNNKSTLDNSNSQILVQLTDTTNNSKPNNKTELTKLTSEDEQVLLRLVVHLKNSWKKIAKRFNCLRKKKVTIHTLRTRYNELAPKLFKKKGKFTHQEDLLLAKYYSKYGSDWEKIAVHIKNRTPNMLKNRYYSCLRKKKLLTGLLDELHLKEEEPEAIVNNKITLCCRVQEHDSETIHVFGNRDGKVTHRTMEIAGFDEFDLELNGMCPDDELHSTITPVETPMNFGAYLLSLSSMLERRDSFIFGDELQNNGIDETLEPLDIEVPCLKVREDIKDDLIHPSTPRPHTYQLRERRSRTGDYYYKRDDYF
jgi:hypothetical protein